MSFDYFACIEMAIFNTSGLSGSYQIVNGAAQQTGTGSVGFQDDIKIMQVYNDGTTAVTLSFDGLINHLYIPSKATLIVDFQANHPNPGSFGAGTKNGRKGQLIYGKGTAGTGNLYISGYR